MIALDPVMQERANTLLRMVNRLYEMLPYETQTEVTFDCPVCPNQRYFLGVWSVLTHLNDRHYWSRERIADFLDTLDCDLTIVPPDQDRA